MQLSDVGCGQTHSVTINYLLMISLFHPAFPALPFFVAPQTSLCTPCSLLSDSNSPQGVLHSPSLLCSPPGAPSPAGSALGPGEHS